jgi:hypothetical protein
VVAGLLGTGEIQFSRLGSHPSGRSGPLKCVTTVAVESKTLPMICGELGGIVGWETRQPRLLLGVAATRPPSRRGGPRLPGVASPDPTATRSAGIGSATGATGICSRAPAYRNRDAADNPGCLIQPSVVDRMIRYRGLIGYER